MIEGRKVEAMNQRLVNSVAQIILSMSEEERRAVAKKVDTDNSPAKPTEPSETNKSFRVAEIAQQIASYESRYPTQQSAAPATLDTGVAPGPSPTSSKISANQEALSSFFELAQSLKVEGPADFSSRVDDYLTEDALSTHD